MSWKATAYVKGLTENITQSEKFLLLILADYHNTAMRSAWPSVALLAEECLMHERTAIRTIRSLETKDFIRRKPGGGRGYVTGYLIGGIDYEKGGITPSFLQQKGDTKGGGKGGTKGGNSDTAIRKEQDLEPVLERGGVSPSPGFTQADFDERDLRKLADAYAVLEQAAKASVGRPSWTEKQAVEFVCERTGITVERYLDLQKKQKQWPLDWDKAAAATA